MSIITPQAKARIAAKSLPEQLEEVRRQMQRESGAGDMQDVEQHLNADNWQTRCVRIVMPCEGAD